MGFIFLLGQVLTPISYILVYVYGVFPKICCIAFLLCQWTRLSVAPGPRQTKHEVCKNNCCFALENNTLVEENALWTSLEYLDMYGNSWISMAPTRVAQGD